MNVRSVPNLKTVLGQYFLGIGYGALSNGNITDEMV